MKLLNSAVNDTIYQRKEVRVIVFQGSDEAWRCGRLTKKAEPRRTKTVDREAEQSAPTGVGSGERLCEKSVMILNNYSVVGRLQA